MKHLIATSLCLLLFWGVQAQNEWIVFDWTNSSLPGNNCSGIYADDSGTMWIATNQGVAKYDQNGWGTYTLPSTGGILPNFLSSTQPDHNGDLWAGAFQNGLSSYKNGTWTQETTGNIKDVHVDSINQIWTATSDMGVKYYDGTNWVNFRTNNTPGFNSDVVNCITDDGAGNIYVGFDPQGNWLGGMAKYDGTTWTRWNNNLNNLPDNRVNRIAFNPSGKMFLATDAGLAEGSGSSWGIYNTSNSDLPSDLVNTVSIDSIGKVWVGTEAGLAIFDGTNWTVFNTGNSGLLDNRIREIAFDNSGHTWMATGAGVAIYKAGGASVSIDEPLWASQLKISVGPNPLVSGQNARMQLDIPVSEEVQVSVLNFAGQMLSVSPAERLGVGYHELRVKTNGLAAGIYLVRTQIGQVFRTEKLIVR